MILSQMFAGSQTAARTFEDVLREQQGMVFSIAYHHLRDRAAAEEVAQDVFLQLHRRFGDFSAPEAGLHLVNWLRKVATHRSIDYARRRRTQPSEGLAVNLDDVAPQGVNDEPGDFLLHEKIGALIASLPEKPRMVMVLRYQEEMMPEEIARTLDMPVRTVKSHLQRSLQMLREKIERRMGDVR